MHRHCLVAVLLTTAAAASVAQQPAAAPDWHAVEQALGRSGAPQPGGVIKFAFPRSDLAVTVGDVTVKPGLALGTWLAFMPQGSGAMAMGDLVLLTAEVAPVMRALEAGGVHVAAVHNHLLGEMPRIIYMHIVATGDPAKIAAAVHTALELTGTPLAALAPPAAMTFSLDTAALARALGTSGKVNGGIYQVSAARSAPITIGGMTVPPSMGLATAINIQPLDAGRAAASGDFVLTADQVTPVMQALTAHGIAVTALHSHLMSSTPSLLFMHFWVADSASKVAAGLGAALAAAK